MRIDYSDDIKYYSSDFYSNPAVREVFLNNLIRDSTVKDYEVEFKDSIGVKFYGIISSTIINYNGNSAIFSVILDITQRKKTEIKLLHASQHGYSP